MAVEFEHVDNTSGDAPAELMSHFQGEARLQTFPNPFPDGSPAVFAVHFRPGGRTKPHTHRNGQMLHVTSGKGLIGSGDGRRVVGPGDVVVVMPGEWHWHGATTDSSMTHVTVQLPGPDSVNWDVEERDWAQDYDT